MDRQVPKNHRKDDETQSWAQIDTTLIMEIKDLEQQNMPNTIIPYVQHNVEQEKEVRCK